MAVDPKFVRAEELGIRLEVVRGLPIWEAAPSLRHQRAVIVLDPITLLVLHVTGTRATREVSPQVIELACGCKLGV